MKTITPPSPNEYNEFYDGYVQRAIARKVRFADHGSAITGMATVGGVRVKSSVDSLLPVANTIRITRERSPHFGLLDAPRNSLMNDGADLLTGVALA